jgi:hypothetical protein
MVDDKDAATPETVSPTMTKAPAGVAAGGAAKLPDELPDEALDDVAGGCCSGKHIDT